MEENIGIKIVAGFFAVGGILLIPVGIAIGLGPLGPTDASYDGPGIGTFLVSTLVILSSAYAISTSNSLHKLKRSAYKAAFALLAIFLLLSVAFVAFDLLHGGALLQITITFAILLTITTVPGTILFMNRNLFSDHQSMPANEVDVL